jgi:hypothetical protein
MRPLLMLSNLLAPFASGPSKPANQQTTHTSAGVHVTARTMKWQKSKSGQTDDMSTPNGKDNNTIAYAVTIKARSRLCPN